MTFPVPVLGMHPHRVFDVLALLVGTQLFWWGLRRAKARRTGLSSDEKWTAAVGCIVGAALGAKLIVLLEDPAFTLAHARSPAFWASGKSIVGALLGGLVGVEVAKASAGITRSTGDHFVVPLAVGLAVGRVGCFLSGLEDDTYGVATSLPWGVDFGDGVARHPTQLYEIAFALAFLALVPVVRRRVRTDGDLFALFMVAYLAFRFAEEFLRVSPRVYLGLSVYQVGCLAGLAYYLLDARRRARLVRLITPTGRGGDAEAPRRDPLRAG